MTKGIRSTRLRCNLGRYDKHGVCAEQPKNDNTPNRSAATHRKKYKLPHPHKHGVCTEQPKQTNDNTRSRTAVSHRKTPEAMLGGVIFLFSCKAFLLLTLPSLRYLRRARCLPPLSFGCFSVLNALAYLVHWTNSSLSLLC